MYGLLFLHVMTQMYCTRDNQENRRIHPHLKIKQIHQSNLVHYGSLEMRTLSVFLSTLLAVMRKRRPLGMGGLRQTRPTALKKNQLNLAFGACEYIYLHLPLSDLRGVESACTAKSEI